MAFLAAALPELAEAGGAAAGAEGAAGGAEAAGGTESMKLPGRGLFNDRRSGKSSGGGSDPASTLGNVKAAQGA